MVASLARPVLNFLFQTPSAHRCSDTEAVLAAEREAAAKARADLERLAAEKAELQRCMAQQVRVLWLGGI